MGVRSVVILLMVVSFNLVGQSAKYQAKGAGEVSVKHGTPGFREELLSQARPGLEWRLGANRPTVLETAPALVAKRMIVFPGAYTIVARCLSEEEWELVFREGTEQRAPGATRGEPEFPFPMKRSEMTNKQQHTKRLAIDLQASRDAGIRKDGGAELLVRFGSAQLAAQFLCLPVVEKKGKLGKDSYVLQTVKLPVTEDIQKAFDGEGTEEHVLGRVISGKSEARSMLSLRSGEEPQLVLSGFNRSLKGTRTPGQSKVAHVTCKINAKEITFNAGTTRLAFELSENSFSKAELGGTTKKAEGDGR